MAAIHPFIILSKVFWIAVKQGAKPISKKIQSLCEKNEPFRKLCIRIARSLHRKEYKSFNRYLNEENAVEQISVIAGECCLFLLTSTIIAYEYYTISNKNQELATKNELVMSQRWQSLDNRVNKLLERQKELESTINSLRQEQMVVNSQLTKSTCDDVNKESNKSSLGCSRLADRLFTEISYISNKK